MYSNRCVLTVTVCTALTCFGPVVQRGSAQEAGSVVTGVFPAQLIPGQTTVVHWALQRQAPPVQSVEITPPAGVTVAKMTSRDLGQGTTWWDLTITVAKDAAPGPRQLVGVRQNGRTPPVTLTIPDHVPSVSNLRILSAQVDAPTLDLQFAASNQGGKFGDTPYVWFLLTCAPAKPEIGVVYGKLENGNIRVSIPNPRGAVPPGDEAPGSHCDLELRATDASGTDSNRLTTAVDFK